MLKPEIRNGRGELVAGADRSRWIRMRAGVRGVDGSHLADGERYLVPEWFALALVNEGRAQYAEAPDAPVAPVASTPSPAADTIAQRDPVVEHRDPQLPGNQAQSRRRRP